MYKHLYSRFLQQHTGWLHFASHSHHYWPDVTRDATLRYWDDSAARVDDKWEFFFNRAIPQAQQHIARHLNLSTPQQLVFAPNTHEFVVRLLSCLPNGSRRHPVRILTSDSEFHSFRRQLARLAEEPEYEIISVASEPIDSFAERCRSAIAHHDPHMLFFSQVFFNSGLALTDGELETLMTAVDNPDCLIAIDGYHAFCALPTDLSRLQRRIFYLAGSYKYAQGGEGGCFMHVPPDCTLRPRNTGWFAELDTLADTSNSTVLYREDGMRFAGATFDLSALYRLNAVMDLYQRQSLDIPAVHAYIEELQSHFLEHLERHQGRQLNKSRLILATNRPHGHFLALEQDSTAQAQALCQQLADRQIQVDSRGSRVRFGFGLYQDKADIDELFQRIQFDRT